MNLHRWPSPPFEATVSLPAVYPAGDSGSNRRMPPFLVAWVVPAPSPPARSGRRPQPAGPSGWPLAGAAVQLLSQALSHATGAGQTKDNFGP